VRNVLSAVESRPQLLRLRVRVRPINRSDAGRLAEAFASLSPQSKLARFLAPKHSLSRAELRYLTEVDHHDHEALVAVSRFRGRVLGAARFVRNSDDLTSAEVAVEVIDEVQGRGIGRLLAVRLAERARAEKITTFTALMAFGNTRARRLLAALGKVDVIGRDQETIVYRTTLDAPRPAGGSSDRPDRHRRTVHRPSAPARLASVHPFVPR
jgi:GNAT superfamily N-acetyltransferase